MSDSGNFLLCIDENQTVWESFWHPSDTLLPGQSLSASLELTSPKSQFGYYSLKMLQQHTSLSLALNYVPSSESHSNFSYWSSPQISNATGEVVAMLDNFGNFAIMYGKSAAGTVYVHKNDSSNSSSPRRIVIGNDGNLHLYEWNSSNIWVSLWSAVLNPCQVAGICGSGICILNGTSDLGGVNCKNLPQVQPLSKDCSVKKKMEMITQTDYYFSGTSTIANFSGLATSSECADHCLSNCDCVSSVYGIVDNEAYCWTLSSMLFGGLQAMTNGTAIKAADKRLISENVDQEELLRAMRVAFWCIQDEAAVRPSMGQVVKMLEGSTPINAPPMPQSVLELVEEGLSTVYDAMKMGNNNFLMVDGEAEELLITATTAASSSAVRTGGSQANYSNSTMSPR